MAKPFHCDPAKEEEEETKDFVEDDSIRCKREGMDVFETLDWVSRREERRGLEVEEEESKRAR